MLIKIPSIDRLETLKKFTAIIKMNFSLEKLKNKKNKKKLKKCQTLPWACFEIMIEGLFFISSERSIESPFLLFCKVLVNVVFALAINRAVSIRLSIPNNHFFSLRVVFSSSKLLNFRLYFIVIYEVIRICVNSQFCEKCNNTDLRAEAKLYRPNLTAVDYSLPGCETAYQ